MCPSELGRAISSVCVCVCARFQVSAAVYSRFSLFCDVAAFVGDNQLPTNNVRRATSQKSDDFNNMFGRSDGCFARVRE